MAINPRTSAPQVQITEQVVGSTTTIQPLATGHFVLDSDKGQAYDIISVDSEQDLIVKFGEPNNGNRKQWWNVATYLKYASPAYVIRPIDSDKATKNVGISFVVDDSTGLTNTNEQEKQENLYNSDMASNTIPNISLGAGTPAASTKVIAFYNRYVTSQQNVYIAICSNTTRFDESVSTDITGTFKSFFNSIPDFANGKLAYLIFQKDKNGDLQSTPTQIGVASYSENSVDNNGNNDFLEQKINNDSSSLVYCKVNLDAPHKTINTDSASAIPGLSLGTLSDADDVIYPNVLDGTDYKYDPFGYVQADIDAAFDILLDPELAVTSIAAHPKSPNKANTVALTRTKCVAYNGEFDETQLIGKTSAAATTYTVEKFGTIDFDAPILTSYTTYASMYSNMAKIYDPYAMRDTWISLLGGVIGTVAATDRDRAPWFANAGLQNGVLDRIPIKQMAVRYTQADNNKMYSNSINPIVFRPGVGAVIFGNKTFTSQDIISNRLHVRRLLNEVEKSSKIIAEKILFSQNTTTTRSRLELELVTFFNQVQQRLGVTEFLVDVSEALNPQEIRDQQLLRFNVKIKPTPIAEFIEGTIIATPQSAEFTNIAVAA